MKKRRGIGKKEGYEKRAGRASHRFFIWAWCIWLGLKLSAQVEGLLWVRWKAMKSTWRGWLDKWGDFTLEGEGFQFQLCLGFWCHCVCVFFPRMKYNIMSVLKKYYETKESPSTKHKNIIEFWKIMWVYLVINFLCTFALGISELILVVWMIWRGRNLYRRHFEQMQVRWVMRVNPTRPI